jgi:hypothetical protein
MAVLKQTRNPNTRLPCKIYRDRIITVAIRSALRYYPESTQRHCGQVEILNNFQIFKIEMTEKDLQTILKRQVTSDKVSAKSALQTHLNI